MVLKGLTDGKLTRLNIEVADREEVVYKSTQPLMGEHKVKSSYVDDVITGAEENGPYIVPTKHVTPLHARPEPGVPESTIGIAILKTLVVFGNETNDPVKYPFHSSAKSNMEHPSALVELAGMFEDIQFYRLLEQAESTREVMEYISKQKKEETDMYRTLICCRADIGSSMLLKIKADQIISENGYSIQTEYGSLDSSNGFSGDLVTTMDDLADKLKGKISYALGIRNIMDKAEVKFKMEELLAAKQG